MKKKCKIAFEITLSWVGFQTCVFLSDGWGTWENERELRVPEISHPASRCSAENHEWDLQERLQRQHHAPKGASTLFLSLFCHRFHLPISNDTDVFLFLFPSLLPPAWPVSWNSSISSTVSSLYLSGNLRKHPNGTWMAFYWPSMPRRHVGSAMCSFLM